MHLYIYRVSAVFILPFTNKDLNLKSEQKVLAIHEVMALNDNLKKSFWLIDFNFFFYCYFINFKLFGSLSYFHLFILTYK